MAVKLRLTRMGRKKMPFYRIVAIDSRKRRDGEYLDKIGHYNPQSEPAEIVINKDKAITWLDRGAIPSETVKSFLRRKGILLEWDLLKRGLDKEAIETELQKWQQQQQEREKRKEAMAAMQQREEVKEAPKAAVAEETVEAAAETEAEAEAEAEADTSGETETPETTEE